MYRFIFFASNVVCQVTNKQLEFTVDKIRISRPQFQKIFLNMHYNKSKLLMKNILLVAAVICISIVKLSAQNVDPWITKAYKELYNRTPTTDESNIKNYNNGTWNNYCELVSYVAGYNNNRSGSYLKGDPWLFKAYCELYNRVPTVWELNIKNYNNGSWNSYEELKNYIRQYFASLSSNRLEVKVGKVRSATTIADMAAVFLLDGRVVAIDLIGNDAGSLKAVGGPELISKGVTGVIGQNGASLISDDGSTLKNLQGVSFSGYSLKSEQGAKKIKTAGKTTLVIF
jgi:hypothetical protein